jgi:type IV pilus assembly protein PilE
MKNESTPRQAQSRARQTGVTLIELMVVVIVLAILTAVALPSYTQFIIRAKRSAGKSMLLQVADRQQQFFMDNKQYSASLAALGFPADTFMIGDDGTFLADGDGDRVYNLSLANTTAMTYTATATPQLRQAAKDTDCANLTLTHTGVKGNSAGGNNCW